MIRANLVTWSSQHWFEFNCRYSGTFGNFWWTKNIVQNQYIIVQIKGNQLFYTIFSWSLYYFFFPETEEGSSHECKLLRLTLWAARDYYWHCILRMSGDQIHDPCPNKNKKSFSWLRLWLLTHLLEIREGNFSSNGRNVLYL